VAAHEAPGRIMPVSMAAISRGAATARQDCEGRMINPANADIGEPAGDTAAATIAAQMWVSAPRPWRPS